MKFLSSPKVFTCLPAGRSGIWVEMNRTYFVYILASKKDEVLYVGVTRDIRRRVWEHRFGPVRDFCSQYKVFRLVYFEMSADVYSALEREKQLKKWNRNWKIHLIEKKNSNWDDLYDVKKRIPDRTIRE